MSQIVVDTKKLSDYASRLQRVNSRLSTLDGRLDKLYLKVGVAGAVNVLAADLKIGYSSKLNRCKVYLEQTASEFESLEKQLEYDRAMEEIRKSEETGFDWKTTTKFMSKFGFVGSTAANVLSLTTTDMGLDVGTAVSVVKSGKGVIEGFSKWKEAVYNRNQYAKFGNATAAKDKFWKNAWGLNDTFKGTASRFRADWVKGKGLSVLGQNLKIGTGAGWTTRFTRNFSKSMKTQVGNYTNPKKAFGSWLGVGLSFATNALQNQEEAREKGISTARAVAETVTETLVDTATGWVIGAAVAAGMAATIGSAPVLLVGAATVGITMGLDYACKKITGAITGEEKGLTETVSDLVLDVGTAVVKGATKVVSGVANAVKSVGSFIGKLFGR